MCHGPVINTRTLISSFCNGWSCWNFLSIKTLSTITKTVSIATASQVTSSLVETDFFGVRLGKPPFSIVRLVRASELRRFGWSVFSPLCPRKSTGGESSHFWFGVMGTRSQSDPTNSPTTVTSSPRLALLMLSPHPSTPHTNTLVAN